MKCKHGAGVGGNTAQEEQRARVEAAVRMRGTAVAAIMADDIVENNGTRGLNGDSAWLHEDTCPLQAHERTFGVG